MEPLIDRLGEGRLLLVSGVGLGVVFGCAAYHARFCLRAATAEVAGGRLGPRLAVWLVAFFSALAAVQAAILAGGLDVSAARQLATTGSLSGAIIGGLLFGCGMILARGCASRLLVLSASGNLRAIVTGLVLTLTAQASLRGSLAPLRETLAGIWTLPGGAARSLIGAGGAFAHWVAVGALIALILALVFGLRQRVRASELIAAAIVGLAIFGGWQLTFAISRASFEVIAVQSITFSGPSTDTLMALVNASSLPPGFGIGLVPGVVFGAMVTAFAKGEARVQRFGPDTPMERYLMGGVLMGFGSMLAGGCAVGAGLSGGAILATTAWVAVLCMWIGAVATELLLRARPGWPATAR
ncbi:YeeE/YedE family protein [Roseobacter sinensis]|uniref:YeeE/YedE family protein n=1 Tax=Roseobacter sinensis TaxID=2931391 RepID=A0ABT3BHC8_9RHOB|nr:YeeE/YedE family protein [Roseobacter sp. WL0113]MCV3272784.1 YeeE/YedE family protein [Roseobacter sp. WL0113]